MMKKKIEKNIHQSKVLERPARKGIHIPTQITVGSVTYDGFIINISSHGVKVYINTTFTESVIDCTSDSTIKLDIKPALGDVLTVQCEIKSLRIQKSSPNGLITSLGMEVIDPPNNFDTLIQRL
jgi:hypothetical protein